MAPIDGTALNCVPWQSARFESLGCGLADRHIRFTASLLKGNGSFFFASLAFLIFGYSTCGHGWFQTGGVVSIYLYIATIFGKPSVENEVQPCFSAAKPLSGCQPLERPHRPSGPGKERQKHTAILPGETPESNASTSAPVPPA